MKTEPCQAYRKKGVTEMPRDSKRERERVNARRKKERKKVTAASHGANLMAGIYYCTVLF